MAPPARLGGGAPGLANSNRPYLNNDDESGERTEAYRKRRVRASFYEKPEIARRGARARSRRRIVGGKVAWLPAPSYALRARRR